MPQLTIKVEGDLVRRGLQDLGAEIPKIGRLQFYQTALRIKSRMSKPGAKPNYPINWVSVKQRKAFFASEGFGGGIPHVRSGRYEGGWDIVSLDDGYRLINRTPGAKFVGGSAYGTDQSPIHAGRWPLFRDVVEEETEKLPEAVTEQINMVARRKGLAK